MPERMQRVQAWIRFTVPSTKARTRCTLASKFRRDTLWAWLTCRPARVCFPQISHCLAIFLSSRGFRKSGPGGDGDTIPGRAIEISRTRRGRQGSTPYRGRLVPWRAGGDTMESKILTGYSSSATLRERFKLAELIAMNTAVFRE